MTTHTPPVGAVTATTTYRGARIDTKVERHAYARNGNTHNPTAYKRWYIYGPSGAGFGSERSLRLAKTLVDDLITTGELR